MVTKRSEEGEGGMMMLLTQTSSHPRKVVKRKRTKPLCRNLVDSCSLDVEVVVNDDYYLKSRFKFFESKVKKFKNFLL